MENKENCVFLHYKLTHILVTSQGLCFRASAAGFQILGSTNPFGHLELWIFSQEIIHKEFRAGDSPLAGQSPLNFNLTPALAIWNL